MYFSVVLIALLHWSFLAAWNNSRQYVKICRSLNTNPTHLLLGWSFVYRLAVLIELRYACVLDHSLLQIVGTFFISFGCMIWWVIHRKIGMEGIYYGHRFKLKTTMYDGLFTCPICFGNCSMIIGLGCFVTGFWGYLTVSMWLISNLFLPEKYKKARPPRTPSSDDKIEVVRDMYGNEISV